MDLRHVPTYLPTYIILYFSTRRNSVKSLPGLFEYYALVCGACAYHQCVCRNFQILRDSYAGESLIILCEDTYIIIYIYISHEGGGAFVNISLRDVRVCVLHRVARTAFVFFPLVLQVLTGKHRDGAGSPCMHITLRRYNPYYYYYYYNLRYVRTVRHMRPIETFHESDAHTPHV